MIEVYLKALNDALEELISPPHALLAEAARYSLLGPGKRIRPLLVLATIEMFGGRWEDGLLPACALELVHTYSLIHDDLPCMDDDDFRRGKPSLHRAYGEGRAVLVGDYFLTLAFEVLVKSQMSDSKRVRLVSLLAQAAGGEGMVGGQVLDLAEDSGTPLEAVHAMKTGALFRAALEMGGVVSGCSPEVHEQLSKLGDQIGLLFQIVDDVQDGDHGFSEEDAKEMADACYHTLLSLPAPHRSLDVLLKAIFSLPSAQAGT